MARLQELNDMVRHLVHGRRSSSVTKSLDGRQKNKTAKRGNT